MTTPESGPPPPSPEQNPAVQELEQLKRQVAKMTTQTVLNALLDTEQEAEDIRDVITYASIHDAQVELKGSPNDPDSYLARAKQVKRAVQVVLLSASGVGPPPPDVRGINDPDILQSARQITKDVLHEINQKIQLHSITDKSAPYYHRLLCRLFDGTITNVHDLSTEFAKLQGLARVAGGQYEQLRLALAAVAKSRGFREFEINEMFKSVKDMNSSSTEFQRGEPNTQKIIAEIRRDKRATEMGLEELYNAFETADTFEKYYREIFAKYRDQKVADKYKEYLRSRKPGVSEEELEAFAVKRAKEEATREVHRKLIYLVNLFYKPVLTAAPNQRLRQVIQELTGPYTPNPDNMFNHLKSRMKSIAEAKLEDVQNEASSIFMGYHQDTRTVIDTERREQITTKAATKELKEVNFDTFIKQAVTIISTERSVLEYGHDFRFATLKGTGDKKFMEQIAAFAAESIESADIDIINTVEYSELVQAARVQLERQFKIAFSKARWRRDDSFLREVFEEGSKIERDIRASLLRDFVEAHPDQADRYPELIIDRCLSHAKTLLFGKEFMLHLMASYADPNLLHGGKPTYSRDPYGNAAIFQPVDAVIRWGAGDITDLDNNHEYFLPFEENAIFYDVDERWRRGRKEFFESFDFGMAAFKDKPPTIALMGNICRAGGVDAWGGYRLQMAYVNWIEDLRDPRSYYRELNVKDGPEDLLVEGWKRIENIGVNVLRNFTSSYLFTDLHLLESETWKRSHPDFNGLDPRVVTRYQKLFGFFYDRYLGYEGSVGSAFLEGRNREQYIDYMTKLLCDTKDGDRKDKLTKEMYKVYSVLLFERSPLEFISMEKPRLTQNGVTLLSEIQNQFVREAGGEREGAERLDAALADLTYLETRARLDSIKQMEEIRAGKKAIGSTPNLYGDLTATRSAVLMNDNGVGGYMINEDYIKNVIRKKYTGTLSEKEIEERIKNATHLYKSIKTRLLDRPEHNHTIESFQAEGDTLEEKERNKAEMRRKLSNAESKMSTRVNWWAEAWEKGLFQMEFTSDTADQFLDRNATGPDTIANAAEGCANTAEAISEFFGFKFKAALKQAAIEKDFTKIYELMGELKDKIEMQDGSLWDHVVGPLMVKRILNTFMRDERSYGFLGAGNLVDTIADRPSSISETYTESEGPGRKRPWSWTRTDALDFLDGAKGMTSGQKIDNDMFKKLRKYAKAGSWEMFFRVMLPVLGMAALAVFVLAMQQGIKENKGN
ncbi:MAG: hypothetical protein N2691_00325 [Patescibacteria group bacterium]|nr:hypothetical protein [Patescibacteria group bacterium]